MALMRLECLRMQTSIMSFVMMQSVSHQSLIEASIDHLAARTLVQAARGNMNP
jgi:hypothetical protein